MEIEIITTKKKLSKSLINQMKVASYNPVILAGYETLGYLHKVYANITECALLKRPGQYVILPLNFEKRYESSDNRWGVTYRSSKWVIPCDFETESQSNLWWKQYERIKNECHNKQIYI